MRIVSFYVTISLLIASNLLHSQDWKFFESNDALKKVTVNPLGSAFLAERLNEIHIVEGKQKGSTLFIDMNSNSSFRDKVLFVPNKYLIVIFKKLNRNYWIAVKINSKEWQKTVLSVFNDDAKKPFFSAPLRRLNLSEKEALSSLVKRIKQVYCPVESEFMDDFMKKLDFFGEDDLDNAGNEIRKKWKDAKEKYLEAVEKYKEDKKKYDEAFEEWKEAQEKYAEEYEAYLEKNEKYEELKRKLEQYELDIMELEQRVANSPTTGRNLKIISDFERERMFYVDQNTGHVVFELIISNEDYADRAMSILRRDTGLFLTTEHEVKRHTEEESIEFNSGEFVAFGHEIRSVSGITLSDNVIRYYNLYKPYDGDLPNQPLAPKEVDLEKPKTPNGVKEVDPGDLNDSDQTQVLFDPNPDEIYEQVVSCPASLKKGEFDFGIKNKDVNTYLIDAPNSSNLSDWLLITGGNCSKCGGYLESLKSEVYAPKTNISIRIEKTIPFKMLAAIDENKEKDRVLSNVYRAFALAQKGKIKSNILNYLGGEGFTYKSTENKWVLNLKDLEVAYTPGTNLDILSLYEWHRIFYRKRSPQIYADDLQVKMFFEILAEGKIHWESIYRQNPLAYLAKYCTITSSKE